MTRALSYSLYLLRSDITKPEEALRNPTALVKFKAKNPDPSKMVLFWREPRAQLEEPDWLGTLKAYFTGPNRKYAGPSLACVAIFKSEKRKFALAFSGGHFLLKESALEQDFGLLACIGAMSEEALRAVERRRIENVPINLSTQAPLDLSLGEMDLLDSLDLVKRLKGRVDTSDGLGKDFDLGKTIQGAQALKFSTKVDLVKMPAIARSALGSYGNKRHPRLREVVSFLRPVKAAKTLGQLEVTLSNDIKAASPSPTVVLAPPTFVDDTQVTHYEIADGRRAVRFNDPPRWDEYRNFLGGALPSIESTKKHRVLAYKGPDDLYGSWQVWKCLTAEYSVGNERYVLDDGNWYAVSKARYDRDAMAFNGALRKSKLPNWGHKEEKDYLRDEIGKGLGLIVLDRTYISTPNGSKFEPCDAIDFANKTLFHLKRRDCGASGLSHVFRQAVAGTQIPIFDLATRAEIDKRIKDRGGKFTLGDPRDWHVVVGIMMRPGDTINDLPYFSVASAVAAVRQLGILRVKLEVEFIPS